MSTAPWTSRFLVVEEHLPWLAGDGPRARLREWLGEALGIPRVRRLFDGAGGGDPRGEDFFPRLVDDCRLRVIAADFERRLPRTGPVVVVSNHPFGGIDALVLAHLCRRLRSDTRILGNAELRRVPAMHPWLFFARILGEDNATRDNVRVMRRCVEHVRGGGLLAVFPSGEVSSWRWRDRAVVDPPWSAHIGRVIARCRAPVLPVCFPGANPWWFQAAGLLHPMGRTALLPRAFLARCDSEIACRAGRPIESGRLPADPGALTTALREAVYSLSQPRAN